MLFFVLYCLGVLLQLDGVNAKQSGQATYFAVGLCVIALKLGVSWTDQILQRGLWRGQRPDRFRESIATQTYWRTKYHLNTDSGSQSRGEATLIVTKVVATLTPA
jgi:hypothetical protein